MSRHDRARGVWHQPSKKGPGRGKGVMKRRRADSHMSKDDFEKLLKRLDIRGRS